jgi:peptide/nickel transport system permease protein
MGPFRLRSTLASLAVTPQLWPLATLLVLALLGPELAPRDPLATDVAHALSPPGPPHWFGTDQLGRDILSRVLAAGRLDLAIAFVAVALSAAAGATIGAICGFTGGAVDEILGRLTDVLMAFPLFIVAMALVAVLGNTVANVVYTTAIINLPFYIRFARAETLGRRQAGYVKAARLGGASEPAVLFSVLMPALLPGLMVQMSINLGWAVLNTAGLSFIGLGVRPPTPEWGALVGEGAQYVLSGQWWVAAWPSLALTGAVLAFSLAGDALRDFVDVRSGA